MRESAQAVRLIIGKPLDSAALRRVVLREQRGIDTGCYQQQHIPEIIHDVPAAQALARQALMLV